jgi:phosphate acetyltransferase
MDIINEIRERARTINKKIVLPEGEEDRVIKAAAILQKEKLVQPILIGSDEFIAKKAEILHVDLQDIQIMNPVTSKNYTDEWSNLLFEMRKKKGMTQDEAKKAVQTPLYFGAFVVRTGLANGSVAGSINTTGDVIRAGIHVLGLVDGVSVVSSAFIMVLSNGKVLTYGDCGVLPNPDAAQLASIAISTARTHKLLLNEEPVVAMLSFSTKGSAKHEMVDKVIEATQLVTEMAPDLRIDGELQFDAAYIPAIAEKKAPGSKVAGQANVFIFPDLNAGNIAYKITQRLAGAEAFGPLIQGLKKPFMDLSRGCSTDDIVNVASICSILS